MNELIPSIVACVVVALVGAALAFRLYFQAARHFAEIEMGLYKAIELYAKEALEASATITQLQMTEQRQRIPLTLHYTDGEEDTYYSELPPQYISRADLN